MSLVTRAEVSVACVAARRSAARSRDADRRAPARAVPRRRRPPPRPAPAPRPARPGRARRGPACRRARRAAASSPSASSRPRARATSAIGAVARRRASRRRSTARAVRTPGRRAAASPSTGACEISDAERARGARAPSSSMSLLPVRAQPGDVPRVVDRERLAREQDEADVRARRSGVRTTSSPSPTRQPTISQSACALPLANVQRPLTTSSSPSATARPRGAKTPPTIASPP